MAVRTAAVAALGITLTAFAALAQPAVQYPARPVRVLVPAAAGGTADVVGRQISDRLSRLSGQQFVVENRAGGAGAIGIEALTRAPRDGYTIAITAHSPIMITPHLRTVGYDPATDLVAVAMLAENVAALAVHPSVPAQTFRTFIDYARANKGKLNYVSGGPGSIQHLRIEMLNRLGDLGMEQVPYKSAGEGMNDVLAGLVPVVFESVVFNFARTGQLRLLAVSDDVRHPEFPDIPTIKEVLPAFRFPSWTAMFVATGTPRDAVVRLNALVNEVLREKDMVEQMWKGGYRVVTTSPEETRAVYERDSVYFKQAIAEVGLKKE